MFHTCELKKLNDDLFILEPRVKIHIKKTFNLSNMDIITGKSYFIDAQLVTRLTVSVKMLPFRIQVNHQHHSNTEQLCVGVTSSHLTLVKEASLQGTWRKQASSQSQHSPQVKSRQ